MSILSYSVENTYVNLFFSTIHRSLWMSPVDKSVEIVEKFRFSTILPEFYTPVDKCFFRFFSSKCSPAKYRLRIMSPVYTPLLWR